jgi:hypothetical protein
MALVRVVAHDTRRPEVAWKVMGGLVALISLWQGFGYALGGDGYTTSPGWQPLLTIVQSLRVHGLIMLALGFALAVQLRGSYDQLMLWTLRLLRTYSLIVAACWFGSWLTYGPTWGAPGWWLLLAALTTWLTWFPPVAAHRASHGRP